MRSDAPKTQAGPKPGATEVCARALRAGQPRSPFGEGGGVFSRSLPDETSYSGSCELPAAVRLRAARGTVATRKTVPSQR
jgi:hypothetical protein